MAFRVLLSPRLLAPTAAVLVAIPTMHPRAAHAEEAQDPPAANNTVVDFSKKPIYDAPESSPPAQATSPPTRPTPTDRLAAQIKVARLRAYKFLSTGEAHFNMTMARAFDLEDEFSTTVASLAPAPTTGERILPNGLYVLVSTMTSSILVRNRGLFLRATLPTAVGIGAAWTFLPYTMRNVSDLVWEWEKKIPAIAETHERVRKGIEDAVDTVKSGVQGGKKWADSTVGSARSKLEGLVKEGK